MDDFTDDQRMLDDTVARYLQREYPAPAGRAALSAHADAAASPHWRAWADLGLLGLALPAEAGGMEAGLPELCVLMQRFGQHLVREPYDASALLCGQLLARLPAGDATGELLAALAAGAAAPVLAHAEDPGRAAAHAVRTRAERDGDQWVLDGLKRRVAWGAQARHLLVSAVAPQGISIFLVPAGTPGLARQGVVGLDGRPYADIALAGCRLPASACLGLASPALQTAQDMARVGLCAEAVGAMQALLDTTCEYVRTRHQFGRPLGAFQAVQHRLVDLLVLLEQARSLTWLAARTDPDHASFARLASAAKAKCGQAARQLGEQSIQLHGGMGMTDELSVGHHVKRLMAIEHTLGDTRHHLARYQRLASTSTPQ